jgi:hypothetical protein
MQGIFMQLHDYTSPRAAGYHVADFANIPGFSPFRTRPRRGGREEICFFIMELNLHTELAWSVL